MVARVRSGQRLRAMPQTAWATMETATSLSPCRMPPPSALCAMGAAPRAKRVRKMADGRVNPAKAASAHQADREADLAGGRAGEKLAQGNDVGELCRAQPLPFSYELGVEIPDMRDRPAKAGAPQPREGREYLRRRAERRERFLPLLVQKSRLSFNPQNLQATDSPPSPKALSGRTDHPGRPLASGWSPCSRPFYARRGWSCTHAPLR